MIEIRKQHLLTISITEETLPYRLAFSKNYDTSVIQNYCTTMPVIDTRNFNSIYDSVSARLSIKEGKKGRKKEVCENFYCRSPKICIFSILESGKSTKFEKSEGI